MASFWLCVQIVGALLGLYFWIKKGFPVPRYIHIMAFLSGILGLVMVYLAIEENHSSLNRQLLMPIIFPLIVYFTFGSMTGGSIKGKKKQSNKDK